MALVQLDNVTRIYTSGDHELRALDGVSLSLEEGKFVVILGPSGAGKSTLLNLLGGLDSPTEGTITVDGRDISKLTDDQLADYRAATVGFVFQFYNLIPTLTVYENVQLVKEISPKALDPYMDLMDLILVMTVEPGFGGQSFMADMMPKVRALRKIIDVRTPGVELEVDGGINLETAKICVESGANVLVAGSATFKAPDIGEFIESLHALY